MYSCVGGGRSYWLLGTRTYLALGPVINKLRGRTDVCMNNGNYIVFNTTFCHKYTVTYLEYFATCGKSIF